MKTNDFGMSDFHTTVLLKETIDFLRVKKDGMYIDATLGGGGHSFEILKRGGNVLGLDADQEALRFAEKDLRFKIKDLRIGTDLILVKGNFKDIDKFTKESKLEKVNGVVFDLGVSSHQLESADRGFSFARSGPLDMRMDRDLSISAMDLVNGLSKKELTELFEKLGEERFARRIAERIVEERSAHPIQTTHELAEIVRRAVPAKGTEINPATRVFQALRIAINDELNNLRDSLSKTYSLVESKGRICVISFHSLEDRIVKQQFKEWEEKGIGTIITKKPIVPSSEEVDRNKRARSAKLRVIEIN